MSAPKVRNHRSADALLGVLHRGFAAIAEHRLGAIDMAWTDALMSAFALFSLTSPSLLAFDKERTAGNVPQVYSIERVPCDTALREMLDPVEPESLRPLCKRVFGALQRGKALDARVCVEGHDLLALDGPGYFSSQPIHGASCLDTHQRHGTVTSRHQRLGAARVHPEPRAVMPLLPEPMITPEGTDKNDCERHAAKRVITTLRQDPPHLKLSVTEDSLSSNAPHLEVLPEHHLHSLLGVKEGDQSDLFAQVATAEQAGRVTYYERDDLQTGLHHRFRFVNDVPRKAAHTDLRVHLLECWEWDPPKAQVQHFRWVTDLRVNKGTGYKLRRGGRARWRIATETFNTLKNQGYHFEHNFGQDSQQLSVVFALLMMLAFFVDPVQQLCCPLFQAGWAKLGSTRRLWEKMRALLYDDALESLRHLFEALLYGLKKSAPSWASDSS